MWRPCCWACARRRISALTIKSNSTRSIPTLAARYGVALYPFFLDGVADDPKLNQTDGEHPNRAGVEVIVARVLPAVEGLLRQIEP